MSDLSVEIIDALNKVHGAHPGYRTVHANGVCASGSFTPAPAAAALTTAVHMGAEPVPVTVRFSNGGGDPSTPDGARDGRGMAIKFHLPDGGATDIVAVTLPAFFVRTPEDFLDFVRARTPDPTTGVPDIARFQAFVAHHPEALLAVGAAAAAPPPSSYACLTYNAIHAFRWINAAGEEHLVRYRVAPAVQYRGLRDEEANALPPNYLRRELQSRLAEGPIAFTLYLQVAAESDDPDDPTTPWPESREVVRAGRFELTQLVTDPTGCDGQIFDPTNVTAGIECSNDPILHARSGAYSVSYERRRRPLAITP